MLNCLASDLAVTHVNASINALIYSFNQSGYAIIEIILEIFPTHVGPWGRAHWTVCVFKPTSGTGALPSILTCVGNAQDVL